MNKDVFWESFEIPINEEHKGFEFVNRVDVAEHFLKMVAYAARLGRLLEELLIDIDALDEQLAHHDKLLYIARVKVLAEGYTKLAKSADREMRDVFIYAHASPDALAELTRLEGAREILESERRKRIREREKLRHRLKFMDYKADWAKQYLDNDKLERRLEHAGRA